MYFRIIHLGKYITINQLFLLFLTDEPKYWYFEIIIIMHKCVMTGGMVIVGNGTPTQPLVAMIIQMIFLLIVLKMAPYNDDLDDWSSFVCSLALTLTTNRYFTKIFQSFLFIGMYNQYKISSNLIFTLLRCCTCFLINAYWTISHINVCCHT